VATRRPARGSEGPGRVTLDQVVELAVRHNLAEIEVEPVTERTESTAHLVAVEAPMVGTFYRAPKPDAPPFVAEGDVVKEGQVLCIVEAMKLMNEIEAKAPGRIVKVMVENGQPVEFGQSLFLMDPLR